MVYITRPGHTKFLFSGH